MAHKNGFRECCLVWSWVCNISLTRAMWLIFIFFLVYCWCFFLSCVVLLFSHSVVGDLHGQFYDLLRLFEVVGSATSSSSSSSLSSSSSSSSSATPPTQFLFLGDYVDRGCFATEIVIFLYACKLATPHRFYLLRGNHECRQMTQFFNFFDECMCTDGWIFFLDLFLSWILMKVHSLLFLFVR